MKSKVNWPHDDGRKRKRKWKDRKKYRKIEENKGWTRKRWGKGKLRNKKMDKDNGEKRRRNKKDES